MNQLDLIIDALNSFTQRTVDIKSGTRRMCCGDPIEEKHTQHCIGLKALAAARELQALAQPEQSKYSDIVSDGGLDPRNKFDAQQEPVAWMASDNKDIVYASEFDGNKKSRFNIPLFTAPLKSKFVRLTDEEKDLIACHAAENDWHDYEVINAAEAKLKEKNT